MSYLSAPRLAFAGRFMSDVSTVNNSDSNYSAGGELDLQWNPRGAATFELLDCRIQGGAAVAQDDIVRHCVLVSGSARAGAKMVDLDPAWQQSSQIWGLTVRLIDPATGELGFEGEFEVAAFRDLYVRQLRESLGGNIPKNKQSSGGRYVSVLKNVRWGTLADRSAALGALRAAANGSQLAMAMHQFGYFYPEDAGRHATGTLIGTIGPYLANEPFTMCAGRRLQSVSAAVVLGPGAGVTLFGPIDFELDAVRGSIHFDVGYAMLIDNVDGALTRVSQLVPPLQSMRSLAFGLIRPGLEPGQIVPAADVELIAELDPYTPDWYRSSGGVVDAQLPPERAARVARARVGMYARLGADRLMLLSTETDDGLWVRADDFVRRLDPGESAEVTIHARRFGAPAAGVRVHLRARQGIGSSSLTFPLSVTTGADGIARVPLRALAPGKLRGPIDGAIVAVDYSTKLAANGIDRRGSGLGGLDVIVAHVRDEFVVPDQPQFHRDIEPIMAQYAQLYPIMSRHLFDLADYGELVRHRQMMLLAFERPIEDPNYMPVTRDLSAAKRKMLIRWLRNETGDPSAPLLRGAPHPPAVSIERGAALAVAVREAKEDAKTAAARAFGQRSGLRINFAADSEGGSHDQG